MSISLLTDIPDKVGIYNIPPDFEKDMIKLDDATGNTKLNDIKVLNAVKIVAQKTSATAKSNYVSLSTIFLIAIGAYFLNKKFKVLK